MSKTLLQVGTVVTKEAAENIHEAISAVIQTAYECRADQATVQTAIRAVSSSLKVENVTITHCHLEGDKTVNMDGKTDADPTTGIGFQ